MKTRFLAALTLLTATAAVADQGEVVTLRTLSGKTYRGVTIAKVDPDGVCFRHSNGAGKILFSDMPSELRSDFGYDAKKQAAYEKEIETRREKARLARIERDREVARAQTAAYEVAAAEARRATLADYRMASQCAGNAYMALPWGFPGFGLGFAGGFIPGDLGFGGTFGGAAYYQAGNRTGFAIGTLPGRCAPVHEYGSAAQIGISRRYPGYGYYNHGAPVHEYGHRLGWGLPGFNGAVGPWGYGHLGGGYANGTFRQPYSPVIPGGRLTNGVPSLGAGFSPSPAISAPGGGGAMFSAGR